MITLSMNKEEFAEEYMKYYRENRASIERRLVTNLNRIKKNSNGQPYSSMIPFTSKDGLQKFYLIREKFPNGYMVDTYVAEIETDNGRVYFTLSFASYKGDYISSGPLDILTEHILKRYAERTNTECEFPKIIKQFIVGSGHLQLVYADIEKQQAVWIVKKGILLSTYDVNEDNFWDRITYRTFVSFEMLKKTQKEACNRIIDFQKLNDKRMYRDKYRSLDEYKAMLIKQGQAYDLAFKLSKPIYAQYFETYKNEL